MTEPRNPPKKGQSADAAEQVAAGINRKNSGQQARPGGKEFTQGLKRLYDSVVDEPLPDNLIKLLAKLDESKAP